MSERINIRLPDHLVKEAKEYAKSNGVSLTDVIIDGLNAVLVPCDTMPDSKKSVVNEPAKPVIVKKACDMVIPARTHTLVQHHSQCACAMCKPKSVKT